MGSGLDKRSILAFVIIGVIVLFMSSDMYREWVGIPTSDQQAGVATAPARPAPAPAAAASDSVSPALRTPVSPSLDAGLVFDSPAATPPERLIRVETSRFNLMLSTRGATVAKYELKGIKSYSGNTVVLVDKGLGNLALSFNLGDREIDTANLVYTCDQPDLITIPSGQSASITFTYAGRDGGQHVLSYHVSDASYRIDVDMSVGGLGSPIKHFTSTVRWESGVHLTESSPVQDNQYTEALALVGTELESYRLGRKEATGGTTFSGDVQWVATRNKYFQLALDPLDANIDQVEITGRQAGAGGADAYGTYGFSLRLLHEKEHEWKNSFALYMGPLQKDELEVMDASLQQSIMTKTSLGFMGFMWPLIRPFAAIVLWVFTKLHLVITNYGVIILLFSVLVKLAVWPLTARSYRSMREMQRIRPLQEDLKRKHANNPKRMQEETMKLFREHKVNPFGGCLPNLLQMPLLFALYFVFRGAYELRGASFVGWITDLSVPDSILSLPFSLPLYGNHVSLLSIIFAVSSYYMMKMTITDQTQKMMLYIMPAMMLLIFNQLPSGLTLYYTLFNFLSTAQQKWMSGEPLAPLSAEPVSPPTATMARKKPKGK